MYTGANIHCPLQLVWVSVLTTSQPHLITSFRLELEDCYRILLAKGADPDRPDSNGNTVLHMCVIVDKLVNVV